LKALSLDFKLLLMLVKAKTECIILSLGRMFDTSGNLKANIILIDLVFQKYSLFIPCRLAFKPQMR
jgi:hypothetical protein